MPYAVAKYKGVDYLIDTETGRLTLANDKTSSTPRIGRMFLVVEDCDLSNHGIIEERPILISIGSVVHVVNDNIHHMVKLIGPDDATVLLEDMLVDSPYLQVYLVFKSVIIG